MLICKKSNIYRQYLLVDWCKVSVRSDVSQQVFWFLNFVLAHVEVHHQGYTDY